MYVLIALVLLSMFVCYKVAGARNADRTLWLLLGLLLGPLAIPFVFFAKPKNK